MKILFLDIDGCLNNNYVGDYFKIESKKIAIGYKELNPVLKRFFMMCSSNDIKIVWMTDWRKYVSYEGLNSIVKQAGFDTSQFIGKTISDKCKIGGVNDFLESNDVSEYCIVDNDISLLRSFSKYSKVDMTRFIITNNAGITDSDIDDMISVLRVGE